MDEKLRKRALKVGKYQYLYQRQQRILEKLDGIESRQKLILSGLQSFFRFDREYLLSMCCEWLLDIGVLDVLYERGSQGEFATHIAQELNRRGFKTHRRQVSRRLKQIQRLGKENTGQPVLVRNGRRWALSSFTFDVWGETEKDVEAEFEPDEEALDSF